MSDWNLKHALNTKKRKSTDTNKAAVQFRDAVLDAVGVVVPEGGEYVTFNMYGADYKKVTRAWKKLEKARAAEHDATAYVLALEFAKHAKDMYAYDVAPGKEDEALNDIKIMSTTNINVCGKNCEHATSEKEKYTLIVSAWEAFAKARDTSM